MKYLTDIRAGNIIVINDSICSELVVRIGVIPPPIKEKAAHSPTTCSTVMLS